jgi:hypothetical protein
MEENIHDELRELSPLLSRLKELPEDYTLPDGYFSQFQQEVFAKINAEQKEVPVPKPVAHKKPIWWQHWLEELSFLWQPRYAIGFASISVVMIATWYLSQSPSEATNTSVAFNELSEEEIHNYLIDNIDGIDTETVWVSTQNEIAAIENKAQTPLNEANTTLQNASDVEIDEMIDEMIQSDEISEEDLEHLN